MISDQCIGCGLMRSIKPRRL